MLRSSELRQTYNRHTDVLTIGRRDLVADVTEDTPSGFVVHYAMPSRQLVGVTVMRYCHRFGGDHKMLHVDADPPFDVEVRAVECADNGGVDFTAFESALRAAKAGRSMFAQ
jgi:hypothetical protein